MVAGLPGIELPTDAQHRHGQPAADRLGHDDQVRLDPGVLEGEHFAGAAETGLHFVEDQQDAVLARHLADRPQPAGRGAVDSALALHRFQDHRRRQ
ncbi:hypothetical protein D3C86_1346640 [compost metagenome]